MLAGHERAAENISQAIMNLECALVELGEGKHYEEVKQTIKKLDKLHAKL